MKERIKELAIEARLSPALLLHHWGKVDALTDSEQEVLEQIEKFAQLIVWEAIGLCRVDVDGMTGPFLSEYEKGIWEGYRRANENLRVYFGVEE